MNINNVPTHFLYALTMYMYIHTTLLSTVYTHYFKEVALIRKLISIDSTCLGAMLQYILGMCLLIILYK